jgi:hypothetical protein
MALHEPVVSEAGYQAGGDNDEDVDCDRHRLYEMVGQTELLGDRLPSLIGTAGEGAIEGVLTFGVGPNWHGNASKRFQSLAVFILSCFSI